MRLAYTFPVQHKKVYLNHNLLYLLTFSFFVELEIYIHCNLAFIAEWIVLLCFLLTCVIHNVLESVQLSLMSCIRHIGHRMKT